MGRHIGLYRGGLIATVCIVLLVGLFLPIAAAWAGWIASPNPDLWLVRDPGGDKACGYQRVWCYVYGSDYDTLQETGGQAFDKPPDKTMPMNYEATEWYVSKGDKMQYGYARGGFWYAWLEWRLPIEQGMHTATAVVPDWAYLADDNPFNCARTTSVNVYTIGSVVHSNSQYLGSGFCPGAGVWWRITWVVKDANGNPFPSEISGCLRASEGFSTWTTPPPCMNGFDDWYSWYPNPYFIENYRWCGVCQGGTPCARGNEDPMLIFSQLMAAWIVSPYPPYNVNIKTKNVTVKYWCDHINWYY